MLDSIETLEAQSSNSLSEAICAIAEFTDAIKFIEAAIFGIDEHVALGKLSVDEHVALSKWGIAEHTALAKSGIDTHVAGAKATMGCTCTAPDPHDTPGRIGAFTPEPG